MYQSFKAEANPEHFVSVGDGEADKAADSGVHSTCRSSNVHDAQRVQVLQPTIILSITSHIYIVSKIDYWYQQDHLHRIRDSFFIDFYLVWVSMSLYHYLWSDCVGFNVPPNTLYVILGMIFTGQMTQPTVSEHRRTIVGQSTIANLTRLSRLQCKVK